MAATAPTAEAGDEEDFPEFIVWLLLLRDDGLVPSRVECLGMMFAVLTEKFVELQLDVFQSTVFPRIGRGCISRTVLQRSLPLLTCLAVSGSVVTSIS